MDTATGQAVDVTTTVHNSPFYALGETAEYGITLMYPNQSYTINGVTYALQGDRDFLLIKIDSTQSTGIAEVTKQESKISIYPNPAFNEITLSIEDVKAGEIKGITISDLTGKVLLTEKVGSSASFKATLNVSDLPAGVYLIKVQEKTGNISTQKFLIQR